MPSRLTENRDMMEASFVFSVWNDPKQYRIYRNKIDKPEDFFKSYPAQFYYNLGLRMFEGGYSEFDKVTVGTYVSGVPAIAKEYELNGGYGTYDDIRKGVKVSNIEGFYNNITKMNCLTALYEKGFSVLEDWPKLQKMSLEQIRRYYTFQLNDTFLNETTTSKVETLEITMDDIEYFIEGRGMGYSIAHTAPLLNYELLGIHEGMSLIGGSTGVGKSAFISGVLLRSWIKDRIKCCIAANEEDSKKWKSVLISMVGYEMFGEKALTRRRLKMGKLSKSEKEMFEAIVKKINEEYGKYVYFIKLYSYSVDEVEIIIDTMSARGVKNFVYDTLKATESQKAKEELVETAKQLFMAADRNHCSVICTCQLAVYMINKRHLDLDNISASKQIPETCHTVLMLRPLWDDEVSGGKYDVKPYNYKYNSKGEKIKDMNGKPIRMYINIEEGTENDYMLCFIPKTRNGKRGVVIMLKANLDYNIFEEVGYCSHVHFNERGNSKK